MSNLGSHDLYSETSDDEYFSSTESEDDDNERLNFDRHDTDDSSTVFSDSEGDSDVDGDNEDDSEDDNDQVTFNFNFGDTISKALILWAVKFGISHTALSALLLILKRFGHNELPKLARTLLKTPRKAVEPRPCAPGEFFYRGIQYNMCLYNDKFLLECDTVYIDVFIDGLSLADSSKIKMWPIMGSFVNQPTIRPFVIGCYSGYCDPISVDDFMKEFVAELEHLQQNGVEVTKHRFLKKFQFRCFIADAPARAFATGTMGHASYFGCPKCDQVCCSEGHKLYYQYFVGELRTDESFRQRTDILHHKPEFQHRRLLLQNVMGMVSQIVIEAMHAIDLRVTKRVVKSIINNETLCRIPKTALDTLQARFKSFRLYVPSDFARKPRTLKEVSKFKATEFRQMLLYTLPVLLKNIVGPQLYNHILKLHVAIRLLSDPNKFRGNIEAARELIKTFVDQFDDIIGKKHFTFYTHLLLHIPDCVNDYGHLYSWSAYPFENHMRIIKRLLRRKHGHIKQFFNRVEELRIADEISNDIRRNESKFNEFNLEANSLRDGCCMIEPGHPLLITDSLIRNEVEFVRGYRFLECSDFYNDPFGSMENMGTILASHLNTTKEEFPVTSIMYKFFRLPFEDKFTKMERLVQNKWTVPICLKNADSSTKLIINNLHAKDVDNRKDKSLGHFLTPLTGVNGKSGSQAFAIPRAVKLPPRILQSKPQIAATVLQPQDNAMKPDEHRVQNLGQFSTALVNVQDEKEKSGSHAFETTKAVKLPARILQSKPKNGATVLQPQASLHTNVHVAEDNLQKSGRSQSNTDITQNPNMKIIPATRTIGRHEIIPLPMNIIKTTPTVQANTQSNRHEVKKIFSETHMSKRKIGVISSVTIPTNIDLPNASLKALKGKPWSPSFVNSSSDCWSTPSLNLALNNSTVSTQQKKFIKVPSSWRLKPVEWSRTNDKFLPLNKTTQRLAPISVHSEIEKNSSDQNIHSNSTKTVPVEWSSEIDNVSTLNKFSQHSAMEKKSNELLNIQSDISSNKSSKTGPVLNKKRKSDITSDIDDYELTHEKKKKSSEDGYENNDKFKTILEELHKIRKKEAKNSLNIKAIMQKLTEQEEVEDFSFPLKTKPENDTLEDCLLKPRFEKSCLSCTELNINARNKITNIVSLKKKTKSSKDTITDLLETVYHPKLLNDYSVHGHKGKFSFKHLKMNQIIFGISGMQEKEYYNDLNKAMNKMHIRYSRHCHEFELI